jgi:hypothetical protein
LYYERGNLTDICVGHTCAETLATGWGAIALSDGELSPKATIMDGPYAMAITAGNNGTATVEGDDKPNTSILVAQGDGSKTVSTGHGNLHMAQGIGVTAKASGVGNVLVAVGSGHRPETVSTATARGDQNTALTVGVGSRVEIIGTGGLGICRGNNTNSRTNGDRGMSISVGDEAEAQAGNGDFVTAISKGIRAKATAYGHAPTAFVAGEYSEALSAGPWAVAIATGPFSSARVRSSNGVAISTGDAGKVRSTFEGSAIFLIERDEEYGRDIVNVFAGIVGKDGIKPATWYTLVQGVLTEVSDEPLPDDSEDHETM